MRYAPRLIPAGSAPEGALVEPLIVDPPKSPLGEQELIPQVAWMVERDGTFVHVADSERAQIEMMRGWQHSGFSVNTETRVGKEDSRGRRTLAEYIARAPASP